MSYIHLATSFRCNARQISARVAALRRPAPARRSLHRRRGRPRQPLRPLRLRAKIDIVRGLLAEGWYPFFAVPGAARDGSWTGHAKHMLRLRRPDHVTEREAPEVVIVNSHAGTTSCQMFAGINHFVCTNSLIAGDRFEEVRVHYKGDVRDEIIKGVYIVANDFPRLVDASREMAALRLTDDEQRVFAEAALVARYGEEEPPVTPDQVLWARRTADVDASLWATFDVAQENIVRGGLLARAGAKTARSRGDVPTRSVASTRTLRSIAASGRSPRE